MKHLADINCRAKLAYDGAAAFAGGGANAYDLIILELMMPEKNVSKSAAGCVLERIIRRC